MATADEQLRVLQAQLAELQGVVTTLAQQQPQPAPAAPAAAAAAAAPSQLPPAIDTRVIGKPEMFFGSREKFPEWSLVFKAYISAIDARVGMMIQILTAKFGDDIPQSLDQFETMVREYEQQSKKVFDDDLKLGLVVVNMTDPEVQKHRVKNASRLDTLKAMKDELLDMARTEQYLDSQARPMELGGFPRPDSDGERDYGFLMPLVGDDAPLAPMPPRRVMVDSGAGQRVLPTGVDPDATDDGSARPSRLSTATGEDVQLTTGKRSQYQASGGRPIALTHNESDQVKVPVVAASEATEAGNWIVSGPGVQRVVAPADARELQEAALAARGVDLVKDRGVYWLDLFEDDGRQQARPLRPARPAKKVYAPPGGATESPEPQSAPPGHPPTVSKAEWDLHQLARLPFRSWCEACATGKAAEGPHWRKRPDEQQQGLPKLSLDYLFISKREEYHLLYAVLSLLDERSGAPFPNMVQRKGDDDFAVSCIHEMVRFCGRSDFIVRNDGENPIHALVAKFVETKQKGITVLRKNTPKGSSQLAGSIERSNYEVETEHRALKARLEKVYQRTFEMSHKMQPWLVRHAGWLLTRFHVQEDGKTPYERLKQKPYNVELWEFAECVRHKHPVDAVGKADDRWSLGAWLGKSLRADDLLAGAERGVTTRRSIWRRPEAQRRQTSLLDRFVGGPWQPAPPGVKEVKPKDACITMERITKFKATEGCPGCTAPGEVRHAAARRERFARPVAEEKERQQEAREDKALRLEEPPPVQPEARNLPAAAGSAPAAREAASAAVTGNAVTRHGASSAANPARAAREAASAAACQRPEDVEMPEAPRPREAADEDVEGGRPVEGEPVNKQARVAALATLREPDAVTVPVGMEMAFLLAAPGAAEPALQELPVHVDMSKESHSTKDGVRLDPEKALQGKLKELSQIDNFGVKDDIPWEEARRQGLHAVNSKWVLEPKPTPDDPKAVRAQLVAREVNTYSREDVTQSARPIKVFRVIVSAAAAKQRSDGSWSRLIAGYDISVAFFHADSDGRTAVAPPPDVRKPGVVWFLKKAMCGTRPASRAFGSYVIDKFKDESFDLVAVVPMTFVSAELDVSLGCRGDDFLAVGGEAVQLSHLKRVIRWTPEGFTWEGNIQRIRDLVGLLGLVPGASKGTDTPGSKDTAKNRRDALNPLGKEDANLFRSAAGTLHYLAEDAPTVKFTSSQVMEGMTNPTVTHQLRLHRAARHLLAHPGEIWECRHQKDPHLLTEYVDSDWAADSETRKSESCACETYGSRLLDASASKQQMMALSSGEAEFHSIIKGTATGIQTKQMLEAVLRHPVSLEILSDSSAARGICQRQGGGRVRHLSARDLRAQEFFRAGQGGLKKVGAEYNWADLGT
ncbi:unnamed protein product, partial [Prorocentrum cordatum]